MPGVICLIESLRFDEHIAIDAASNFWRQAKQVASIASIVLIDDRLRECQDVTTSRHCADDYAVR